MKICPSDYLIIFCYISNGVFKHDWRCINGSLQFATERADKILSDLPEGSQYAIYELKDFTADW